MLPNFMCIGAQKSGTTTLWHILNSHPDIFMAQPRETRFFYDETQFSEGIQAYEIRYFSQWAGQAAVGEKCPEYLFVPDVAHRIHKNLGSNMKFIVALRSPAQRAFAHYRHNLAMFRECRSFEDVIEAESQNSPNGVSPNIHDSYLSRGYYAKQLANYFLRFSREQFMIINFEKALIRDQERLANELFDFLEVERILPEGLPYKSGHPRLENMKIKINLNGATPETRYLEFGRKTSIRKVLHSLKNGLKKTNNQETGNHRIYNPSSGLIGFANCFTQNKPSTRALTREKELEINRQFFSEDIEKLRSLTSFDTRHWIDD